MRNQAEKQIHLNLSLSALIQASEILKVDLMVKYLYLRDRPASRA
jgi:hypothetical protein